MVKTEDRPATPREGDAAVRDAVIVGAGFAGIGMAIKLREAGIDDFVVLERASDVGGTWRDNSYPGCACDIPSRLYSFSFAPEPAWTRAFPTQPEIQTYLQRVAERYAVRPYIRFNSELSEARFDEATATWTATTRDGRRFVARALIAGMGALSKPHRPEVLGLDRFAGPVFHSAAWRHDVSLRDKNVAVIGTGASAIQFVPQIAPDVAQLWVFQRTPPWIMPKFDRPIGPRERALLARVPIVGRLLRYLSYWLHELRAVGFTKSPRILRLIEGIARAHLRRQVPDARLRARLQPEYRMGCKRVLLSNDYYPALMRSNVALITQPIERFEARSVVTSDGVERPVDAVVFGTGFEATAPVAPVRIYGRGGVELGDAWRDAMQAYLGISVAGFPNLFMLVGPNTGLGHNSMVYMIESQVRYIVSALTLLHAREIRALDVRADAQRSFNADLQRRMSATVWKTGGCRSWYLDERGRNTTLWPGFTFDYRRRTRRIELDRYVTQ